MKARGPQRERPILQHAARTLRRTLVSAHAERHQVNVALGEIARENALSHEVMRACAREGCSECPIRAGGAQAEARAARIGTGGPARARVTVTLLRARSTSAVTVRTTSAFAPMQSAGGARKIWGGAFPAPPDPGMGSELPPNRPRNRGIRGLGRALTNLPSTTPIPHVSKSPRAIGSRHACCIASSRGPSSLSKRPDRGAARAARRPYEVDAIPVDDARGDSRVRLG